MILCMESLARPSEGILHNLSYKAAFSDHVLNKFLDDTCSKIQTEFFCDIICNFNETFDCVRIICHFSSNCEQFGLFHMFFT